MEVITATQLASRTAGGMDYIRTRDGIVKGVAVTQEKNPEAPNIIVVGKRKSDKSRIPLKALRFVEQGGFVPVYLKQKPNAWVYLGRYKAVKYDQCVETIERYKGNRATESIDGILFLEPEIILDITNSDKPSSGVDANARKKVEIAAIDFVTTYYARAGYNVTDRQGDNCGYDLLVKKGRQELGIEVKGTSGGDKRFFLSRNERAQSIVNKNWRLALVCYAAQSPELTIYTTVEMERTFGFQAMSWECKEK